MNGVIFRLAALAAGVAMVTQAWAGAVFTTNNQVAVGDVTEDANTVFLKMEFGTVKYKKDKVRWYTLDPKVSSIYMAGLEANRQGQAEVAVQLLRESAKREAKYRSEAEKAIKKISREMAPEPKVAETPPARKEEKKEASDNAVTRPLANKLVRYHEQTGEPMGFDQSEVAGKQYYAIYYSAHWCPPCRAFTPKLVDFYNKMKPDHGDKFEVIFVSYDNSKDDMTEYMKSAKMPWPAVAYDQRGPSRIETYRQDSRGIPCLVVVDSGGNILAHSYVNGQYVGPVNVMEQLRKLLTGE